jgi:hypothetical protein
MPDFWATCGCFAKVIPEIGGEDDPSVFLPAERVIHPLETVL